MEQEKKSLSNLLCNSFKSRQKIYKLKSMPKKKRKMKISVIHLIHSLYFPSLLLDNNYFDSSSSSPFFSVPSSFYVFFFPYLIIPSYSLNANYMLLRKKCDTHSEQHQQQKNVWQSVLVNDFLIIVICTSVFFFSISFFAFICLSSVPFFISLA